MVKKLKFSKRVVLPAVNTTLEKGKVSTATTCAVWSWWSLECFALASEVKGVH